MDIKLERSIEDKELVITIRCSNPVKVEYLPAELKALNAMKNIVDDLINELDDTRPLWIRIVTTRESIKDKIFKTIIESFKSRITWDLDNNILKIYHEIYNWTFDNQTEEMQNYLTAFGFQKENYYFDNDLEIKRYNMKQEPEFNIDIEDEDEDED